MQNGNIDFERMCKSLGLLDLVDDIVEASDCIDSLADDIFHYCHYNEIVMTCEDKEISFEKSKEYYAQRILKAIEFKFFNSTIEDIEFAIA